MLPGLDFEAGCSYKHPSLGGMEGRGCLNRAGRSIRI